MAEFHPEALLDFVIGIVQLIVGLIIGVFAIYMGIKFVDRLTENIEELEELKKGNISVGIFMLAVIITFATVLQSGVEGFASAITTGSDPIGYAVAIIIGFIQVIVGIIVGAAAIYLAIYIIDKMAKQIDKIKIKGMPKMKFSWENELKKDNKAFAVFIAAILIGLGFVIQAGVKGIASSLSGVYS
jgi:uncharacterized membrane protein YjfL (UPF0719 family)